ncbi:MAG: Gfo/Idh/MocA family oxidoreductase [Bryobacteraceae bacterium]|nr:Gfo/Idh/MocA family oxidoreductase [Bryobacteraceae bacterium]
MERRNFIGTAGAAAAWTALSRSRVFGANDRLNVGLIGCGGRGSLDARLMRGDLEDLKALAPDSFHDGQPDPRLTSEPRNVEIAALCDVDRRRIDRAQGWAPNAKGYSDFRKLLESKDIDAVILATPDHWHGSIAILTCQAGKDIYLEKPVMYSLREARLIREAVRDNKRIVQIGTQHRSAGHIAQAARIVQSGQIGPVYFVRVWNYRNQGNAVPSPDAPVPAGLDWDFWLGPAPAVPFNPDRLSYRNFMDYTNGVISDYGMHRFDSVHQIMGVDAPLTVASSWTHFRTGKVQGDLPDVHQATYEYPGFVLSYECNIVNSHGLGGRTPGMRYYGAAGQNDRPHGMAFYGTEGALFVDRIGVEFYPEETGKASPSRPEAFHMNEAEPTAMHTKNFVDFVRARKEPFANIDAGCRSTVVPLIGNIAAKTGQKLKWDAATETFTNSRDANKLLFREYRKPWDLVRFS